MERRPGTVPKLTDGRKTFYNDYTTYRIRAEADFTHTSTT